MTMDAQELSAETATKNSIFDQMTETPVSDCFSRIYNSITVLKKELLDSRLESQKRLLSLGLCPDEEKGPAEILREFEGMSGEMKESMELSRKFTEALKASLMQIGGVMGGNILLLKVFHEALVADNKQVRLLLDTGYELAPETWTLVKNWMDAHPCETHSDSAEVLVVGAEPTAPGITDQTMLGALSLGDLKAVLFSEKLSSMKTPEAAGGSAHAREVLPIIQPVAENPMPDAGGTEVENAIDAAWNSGEVKFLDDGGHTSASQGSAFSMPADASGEDDIAALMEDSPVMEPAFAPAPAPVAESDYAPAGLPRSFQDMNESQEEGVAW